MNFVKLSSLTINDGALDRAISVYHGELTKIPRDHAVDILIVSAFPNDYMPTPTSLIGSLSRSGVSVQNLADNKEYDLRRTCSFWLSKQLDNIHEDLNIRRVACFEAGFRGYPPEIVGDLFRGLFPFLNSDRDQIVAMPLLASGDQRYPSTEMFDAIVLSASHWMARGLGIKELKIVIRDWSLANSLAERLRHTHPSSPIISSATIPKSFDVFLSFSSEDTDAADIIKNKLGMRSDVREVFDFRISIDKGAVWQTKIDKAITDCRAIVAVISPNYIASPECQEELFQGRLRHKREGGSVLFPIYWRHWDGELALWLQLINAIDCREADCGKLATSVGALRFRQKLAPEGRL